MNPSRCLIPNAKTAEESTIAALTNLESVSSLNRSRRSGQVVTSYRSMNNPASRPSAQDQEVESLQLAAVAAKEETAKLEGVHQVRCEALESFQSRKLLLTQNDFFNHGVATVRPIFIDYKRLFLSETGDFYMLCQAYYAARVFNPLAVATMTAPEISMAIKDLRHFNFDEFRVGNGIIEDMINQIPAYLAQVKNTGQSFWNGVEGSAKYDKEIAKKAMKDPEKYEGGDYTWRNDPIEKARRVWEWWKANCTNSSIHYFVLLAVHLVVLVQVSSASVEHIFSQVKLICDNIGVSCLEESIICRMYERCNDYSILSVS